MGPLEDERSIGPDGALYRVLPEPRYITYESDRQRPTSDSLKDSNYENSCFVVGEISIGELYQLFAFEYPAMRIAVIPAAVLRHEGFIIERRPNEAPRECLNPNSHVVVGPRRLEELEVNVANREDVEKSRQAKRWSEYAKAAKKIVRNPAVAIVPR